MLLNCKILVFDLLIQHIRAWVCKVNILSSFDMQYDQAPIKILLNCTISVFDLLMKTPKRSGGTQGQDFAII